jgi:hypothetical protein
MDPIGDAQARLDRVDRSVGPSQRSRAGRARRSYTLRRPQPCRAALGPP